jgi:hypothetical protein
MAERRERLPPTNRGRDGTPFLGFYDVSFALAGALGVEALLT